MRKMTFIICFFSILSVFSQEDQSVTERLKSKYDVVSYHSTDGGWYSIRNGKWGACDLTGKEIIPPIWDAVYFHKTFYEVKNNGKVGIRDLNNRELLPCTKYTAVSWSQKKDYGGYCEVEIDGKKGVINKSNQIVIPCQYDDISIYSLKEGTTCNVKQNGKVGVYDIEKRQEVLPCTKYTAVRWYQKKDHGGYCEVEIDGKKGVIDKDNNEVIPCLYDDTRYFSLKEQPYCTVELKGKKGVADINGNEIVPCKLGCSI